MKNFILIALSILLPATMLVSCKDDEVDQGYSIFDDSIIKEQNEFDNWLDQYYVKSYNIRVIYNYVDMYSNYDYDLIPAEFKKAKVLTYAARYLWIEAYEEHINAEFFRMYAPRVLHYIGNPGWKSNNSILLGEAEGGLRISFFDVNSIVANNQSTYLRFIKTMHHEYAHIFQQKKATDPAFDKLTPEAYVSDNWTGKKDIDAWRSGCVSPYAASSATEDFVETYAIYVVNTPAYWENMIQAASTDASGNAVDGGKMIQKKFEIVYNYYKDNWGIDITKMRDIVSRRKADLANIDINTLYN